MTAQPTTRRWPSLFRIFWASSSRPTERRYPMSARSIAVGPMLPTDSVASAQRRAAGRTSARRHTDVRQRQRRGRRLGGRHGRRRVVLQRHHSDAFASRLGDACLDVVGASEFRNSEHHHQQDRQYQSELDGSRPALILTTSHLHLGAGLSGAALTVERRTGSSGQRRSNCSGKGVQPGAEKGYRDDDDEGDKPDQQAVLDGRGPTVLPILERFCTRARMVQR
jgi:hypothetical protein